MQNRDKAVVRHAYDLGNVIIFSHSHSFFSLLAQLWDKDPSSAPVWRKTAEPALGTTGTLSLYNLYALYSSS